MDLASVQALLFFVDLMEPIVRKKFVIVYMHTMTSKEQQPTVSFLKHIDSIIDSRSVSPSLVSPSITLYFNCNHIVDFREDIGDRENIIFCMTALLLHPLSDVINVQFFLLGNSHEITRSF